MEQKEARSIQVIHQNPNRLGNNICDVDNVGALQDFGEQLKVDILSITETNTNWNNPYKLDKWRMLVQRLRLKSNILTASIKDGDRTSKMK